MAPGVERNAPLHHHDEDKTENMDANSGASLHGSDDSLYHCEGKRQGKGMSIIRVPKIWDTWIYDCGFTIDELKVSGFRRQSHE
jgi:hypothetical protein